MKLKYVHFNPSQFDKNFNISPCVTNMYRPDNDGQDFHLMTMTDVTHIAYIRFIWSEMYNYYITPVRC